MNTAYHEKTGAFSIGDLVTVRGYPQEKGTVLAIRKRLGKGRPIATVAWFGREYTTDEPLGRLRKL